MSCPPGMVVHVCNLSTWARGSGVWSKPELYETLFQKNKNKQKGTDTLLIYNSLTKEFAITREPINLSMYCKFM